jgi:hypothetical protein
MAKLRRRDATPAAESPEPVARLLDDLDRALARYRVPPDSRHGLLAEVEHDLAAGIMEASTDRGEDMVRRVVRDFGDPEHVAAEWAAADRGEPPRLAWSLVTAAGALAGLLAGGPLGTLAGELAGSEWPVLPVAGAAVGLGVGLPQWALLRRRRMGLALWVPASSAAVALALTAGTWLVERLDLVKGVAVHEAGALCLIGALVGGTLGALQFAAAFGRRGGGPWAALSATALGLALPASGLLALTAPGGFRTPEGHLLLAFLAAAGLGLCTAFGLPALHAVNEPATVGAVGTSDVDLQG